MTTGMEMMLKSLGLDPEKMKAEFQQHAERFIHALEEVNRRLTAIEAKNNMLLAHWHKDLLGLPCAICNEVNKELTIDNSADHTSAGS